MDKILKRLKEKLDAKNAPKSGIDFSGYWQNQLKSQMLLSVDGAGNVTGEYHTAVGDPDNQIAPLVGYATGDILTFTVNYGGSLAVWAGHYNPVLAELVTMWYLAVDSPDDQDWDETLAGSDRFVKLPDPKG